MECPNNQHGINMLGSGIWSGALSVNPFWKPYCCKNVLNSYTGRFWNNWTRKELLYVVGDSTLNGKRL